MPCAWIEVQRPPLEVPSMPRLGIRSLLVALFHITKKVDSEFQGLEIRSFSCSVFPLSTILLSSILSQTDFAIFPQPHVFLEYAEV